jgi:thiol-disulfide isomerase/thioredoxin
MNRIAILLASALAGLALLFAAYGGVRAARIGNKPPIAASKAGAVASASLKGSAATGQDIGDEPVIRFVKNPEPIPPFMARDVEGNVVSSADLKGKVVLVNFWATWCPPCRQEIPEMIQLQNEFKDQLRIISISEDEAPPAAVRAFAQNAHINYPIVMLTQEIEDDFGGIPALPTSFLVNRDGGVMDKHVGYYTIDVYEREIRALSGMQVYARIETFEDTGELFLKNAVNATELPGVDLSQLTPEQKHVALKRMNAESCTCGCGLTLAQCRINDTGCPTSRELAAKIVKEILSGRQPPPDKAAKDSATD